jgi:hypothetical protein
MLDREPEYSRWFDRDMVRRLLTARLGELFPGKKKGGDIQALREEAHAIRGAAGGSWLRGHSASLRDQPER